MDDLELEKLRYPIGKFEAPEEYTEDYLSSKIDEINSFPKRLIKEVLSLSEEQLDTLYRLNG